MYTGAALVLVSIGGVVVRGWDAWDPGLRWAFAGLSTVALVAAGLFLRLPWSRPVSDERRRAVSALLTTGVVVATTGMAVVLGSTQGSSSADVGQAAAAVGVVLAMLVVNLISRTPVSEAGLLGALAWAAWVVVPPGPGTWAFLVGLGVVWAGLSVRWARGRRTSMVMGATLALVASVGMAAGPWAWPTRAGLAAAAVLGLGAFLRGRANYWLALGAGAATALAASVAGDVVGPALALYALQLGLNCLWTPVFFGLRRMRAGMLVLALLWLAVAATLAAFWQVDWVAGVLFVPYLVWVTVAGALNWSVVRLNPAKA
jgi:hypothetical protein